MVSCADENSFGDNYEPSLTAHYLYLPDKTLSFDADQSLSKTMSVGAVTTPWRFSGMADWLTVSPASGSGDATVTATATANTSGDDIRTSVFNFSSTDSGYSYSSTITATQGAATPYINLSAASLEFSGATSSKTVSVTSNTAWTATCDKDWAKLTVAPDKSSITILVDENQTTSSRTATITLAGKTTKTIAVTQSVAKVTNDAAWNTITFGNTAASYVVKVTSDVEWSASTPQSWIDITPSTGKAGTTEVVVSVTANPTDADRRGSIDIKIGTQKISSIVVNQRGRYFDVTPMGLETLPSKGGVHRVHISSNEPWTAVTDAAWLKLSTNNGEGEIDVTMTAEDNASLRERSATTTFTPAKATPVKVTTVQSGRYLIVNTDHIDFFSKGGTSETYTINTDASFTITKQGEWFTLNTHPNAFTITAAENPTTASREGKIVITITDLNEGETFVLEIPIVQKASGVEFGLGDFTPDANWNISGEVGLTITINGFSGDENWNP